MQKVRCTLNYQKSGKRWFDNIVVQGHWAPDLYNRSLFWQDSLQVTRLVYVFRVEDKITTGHDGISEQKLVRHDLLLDEDMEYLDSAMPNDCCGMVI